MLNVTLIGQKWLAAETFKRLHAKGHQLTVIAPNGEDALTRAAQGKAAIYTQLDNTPNCDLIVTAHLHHYLPQSVIARAKHGAIGYHPSLLPRHRGRDAVQWAIHYKDTITGGSVYKLDKGMDTGEIVLQDWCHIYPDDTAQSLWQHSLAPMGVRLLCRAVDELAENGQIKSQPQDERLATYNPPFANI